MQCITREPGDRPANHYNNTAGGGEAYTVFSLFRLHTQPCFFPGKNMCGGHMGEDNANSKCGHCCRPANRKR